MKNELPLLKGQPLSTHYLVCVAFWNETNETIDFFYYQIPNVVSCNQGAEDSAVDTCIDLDCFLKDGCRRIQLQWGVCPFSNRQFDRYNHQYVERAKHIVHSMEAPALEWNAETQQYYLDLV